VRRRVELPCTLLRVMLPRRSAPITPPIAGTFTTICDIFCGSGHGNMKMTIVVE